MLLKVLLEAIEFSVTFVVKRAILVVHRVELESGESSDVNVLSLVGSGIEVGNNEAWDILEFLSELFPIRSHLLAVTAPWSVELDEDIVVVVDDLIIEGLTDNNLEGLAVISRGLLSLEEWLQVSILEVSNEFLNAFNSESTSISREGVLLHVVVGVEKTDGGELAFFNTDELSKSSLDTISNTRDSKDDLTLELIGSLGENL